MNAFVAKFLFEVIIKLQVKYRHIMDYLYEVALAYKFAKCGQDVHIYYPARITGWEAIEIGDNVHINRNALIRGDGGLKIGDNVHIASNVALYTINHNYMGGALPYDHTLIKKPVIIEKNVWIGVNVTIVPGVTIGEGAIIGAGTVVSRDVPPLAIVGSASQRILKFRDESHYNNLAKDQWYGGVSGKLYKENK